MKKVLIIGGGFAGLSAAAHLTEKGYKVQLFEASPGLGGRAYSFRDESTGDIIDNGQHIMMGCYDDTLKFLKITNNLSNIAVQNNLKIIFTDKESGNIPLQAITGVYPLNLLLGILKFKALTFTERISVIKFFIGLKLNASKDLNDLSVKEWLEREGQSQNTIKSLWEIITVGALNTNTSKASAAMFAFILKKMFLSGSRASSIIIPKTGLSEMYCNGAAEYIRNRGGEVCISSRVEKLIIQNDLVTSLIVSGKEYKDFDYIIAAVPFYAINKLFDSEFISTDHFTPSSILSVHIWLRENPFTEAFYGLIDSEVHWIFNHKSYITIVISNADKFMQFGREEILNLVTTEIKKYYEYFSNDLVKSYKVIKEKRATFIPNFQTLSKRPGTTTKIKNFFLAGDWVNTSLPATIEGAVKSGRLAAENIINKSDSTT